MPHDCHGVKLQKGDKVRFVGEVAEIYEGAESCNVTVKMLPPGQNPKGFSDTIITTASMVEKVAE